MGRGCAGGPRAAQEEEWICLTGDGGADLSEELLDLHIHGAFGIDVTTADPSGLDQLAEGLKARGVAGFLPTLVPLPPAETATAVSRIASWIRGRSEGDGRGSFPHGIHFEGPFVSTARCGALRKERLLDADPRNVAAFLEAAGDIPGRPMITLAPEIAGGIALVRLLVRRGFVVSIGHTNADSATLDEARRAGARHMTHFGNAMRPLHHREVGPIGWGLLADDVTVDVVPDLHHLSPEMLRLIFKAKGAARVASISDAVPAAGLPDGTYPVWGETLELKDGVVRNAAGNLAGSACLLDEAVARLTSIGIPDDEALRTATDVPRRILAGP